jgi:exonuclease SbcD
MRILHTADWHLGRIFHGEHLTAHQAHVLDQFVAMARETRPDVIVIAGDVYDRAVPPPDAVSLLDDVLARLVSRTKAHVILIAGNHDSPERLGFAARLLAAARVHVHGRFDPAARPLIVEDAHGPVAFLPLPFLEPVRVRAALSRPDAPPAEAAAPEKTQDTAGEDRAEGEHADVSALSAADQPAAMRAALAALLPSLPAASRRVLIAHAMVAGASASDSERPLAVGGVEAVGTDLFSAFHYVALGHLHRPQQAGCETIRYAGSLLKYSFSEAGHEKSATLVEMDDTGHCRLEMLPFSPRRDVRIITGSLSRLLKAAGADPGRDDWLLARLEDAHPPPDALERLRRAYPHLLQIEHAAARGGAAPESLSRTAAKGGEGRDLAALFAAFHEAMTGAPLAAAARAELDAVLDALRRARREE